MHPRTYLKVSQSKDLDLARYKPHKLLRLKGKHHLQLNQGNLKFYKKSTRPKQQEHKSNQAPTLQSKRYCLKTAGESEREYPL